MYSILNGDNLELLDSLKPNSIDSVVTDGPYGLSFMNKKWDYDVPSVDFWKKVFRVLKPGGHILSFGGTRTYHRMVVNLEDAGFEIRDCISWIYGSGFPKSLNIGKNVDKIEGNERESLGTKKGAGSNKFTDGINGLKSEYIDTKGQSEWEGWGTALKPSQELICLARKPLSEKSIVENVVKWGTGGLNIDGCRVAHNEPIKIMKAQEGGNKVYGQAGRREETTELKENGRFPANTILECICDEVIKGEKGVIKKSNGRQRENHNYNSVGNMGSYDGGDTIDNYNDKGDVHTNPECPCRLIDRQSGQSKSTPTKSHIRNGNIIADERTSKSAGMYGEGSLVVGSNHSDSGGASRFFYQAKVSKKERNLGLESEEIDESKNLAYDVEGSVRKSKYSQSVKKNNHPTCKPINLLTYLCRLITPKGGLILDPYMGSGSTGIASQLEGFNFIGFELDPEYFKIAEGRLSSWEEYKSILKNSQD